MKIMLDSLKPHPLNQKIYGDDDPEAFNELFEKIKKSQWISPFRSRLTTLFWRVTGDSGSQNCSA